MKHIKYFIIAFSALFFFGGRPIEFGKETSFFHGYIIPSPVIRIGLGTNLRDLLIQSSSGMKVYEVKTGYRLLGDDVEEVRVKGEREKLTERFVLLVAQAEDKKEADRIAAELKAKIGGGARIFVDEDKDPGKMGGFQVKLGDFLTRGDALDFIRKLNDRGLKDVWILRDIITVDESEPYWILIENGLQSLAKDSVLYFIPSHPQSFLSFNGRSYRGIFVLKGSSKGIVLVNILNIEDYLKGVVPGEMSPESYGEIEALKAQAVAARTYALKNMGQYKSLGYDLSDTPSSQVYGGMDAECPLSSRAVDETKGEVARYKGNYINALYTSTCGGMTESVENIFAGPPAPYLRSVECTYEKRPEWTLEARTLLRPFLVAGRDIGPETAALISLQVVSGATDGGFYEESCPSEDAWIWAGQAAKLAGLKSGNSAPDPGPLTFLALAKLLVSSFSWQDHVENLLLPSEINFILKDFQGIPKPNRSSLAYCLQQGCFPALLAGGLEAGRPVTRGEVVFALAKVLFGYRDFFHGGLFKEAGPGTVRIEEGSETKILKLSPEIILLRDMEGAKLSVSRLTLWGGEKVRWIERNGEARLLEVVFPAFSPVLDRSSRFNFWQIRKSREELEAVVNSYYPIGHLMDISIRRRGPSRRVLELEINGTDGQTIARGLKVRWALGLRDTLFDVDREYDDEGRVTHFFFSGRGWGHGVGLCQVGAYGMALSRAGYKTILKKYYPGVHIGR